MNLDDVRIATPCPASWADMKGDDRTRFCDLCKLNVYNFGGMTRAEVEALVEGAEGRVCIRMWRRVDGTILTKDCPVGTRNAARRFVGAVIAGVAVLFGVLLYGMNELRDGDRLNWGRLASMQPFKAIASLVRWAEPEPPPRPVPGEMIAPRRHP